MIPGTNIPFPIIGIIAGLLCGTIIALIGWLKRKEPTQIKPSYTPNQEPIGWPRWFMDNSDKFLLTFIMMVLLGCALHVMHHSGDTSQIQFINSLTNTFSGALITLVTGGVIRKTTGATVSKDPDTGKTTGVTTVTDTEK